MDNERRTFLLDKSLLQGLRSEVHSTFVHAVRELPEALSVEEVHDVGIQVFQEGSSKAVEFEVKRERRILFHLGCCAIQDGDIVTAESTATVLKEKIDMVGWLYLKFKVHNAKKHILKDLLRLEP